MESIGENKSEVHCKARFIIIGDSKGKDDGINKKVLENIIEQIKKLKNEPQYLIILGDSICGSKKLNEHKAQFEGFQSIILTALPNIKIIPVVGNHEVNNEPFDDSEEKVFAQVYSSLQTSQELLGYNKTVYFMDIDNIRLIVLNSFHNGECSRITGEQLNWFKCIAKESKMHKFVLVHSPAYPTGAHLDKCLDKYANDRDEFWRIVEECKVDIVFSGHEHNYSRRVIGEDSQSQNKVIQIISGGAGEKLKDKLKSRKGIKCGPKAVHHFVILDVEDDNIKIQAISDKGKQIDEFIYRKTRD